MIHTLEIITDIIDVASENIYKGVKNLTAAEENNKIIAYSLKKINTKPVDPYSILNPDTNSDSPSEKSKGVRFVSAKSITNHITLRNGSVNIKI